MNKIINILNAEDVQSLLKNFSIKEDNLFVKQGSYVICYGNKTSTNAQRINDLGSSEFKGMFFDDSFIRQAEDSKEYKEFLMDFSTFLTNKLKVSFDISNGEWNEETLSEDELEDYQMSIIENFFTNQIITYSNSEDINQNINKYFSLVERNLNNINSFPSIYRALLSNNKLEDLSCLENSLMLFLDNNPERTNGDKLSEIFYRIVGNHLYELKTLDGEDIDKVQTAEFFKYKLRDKLNLKSLTLISLENIEDSNKIVVSINDFIKPLYNQSVTELMLLNPLISLSKSDSAKRVFDKITLNNAILSTQKVEIYYENKEDKKLIMDFCNWYRFSIDYKLEDKRLNSGNKLLEFQNLMNEWVPELDKEVRAFLLNRDFNAKENEKPKVIKKKI